MAKPPGLLDAHIAALISALSLEPHPEGGRFRRIFRSALSVRPSDERAPRPALTSIYFLLTAEEHSRWHRVNSDEVWHFYEGDPLELFWIDEAGTLHREVLSAEPGAQHVAVVPAGCWQAARAAGSYALVGCTVAPGFDFDDFEMIEESSVDRERLLRVTQGLPSFF